jgi:hypothetical protein
MGKSVLTPAYRRQIASRCVAAAVGGFVLTSAASVLLAWLAVRLGWAPRASAVHAATLASFAVWAAVILWAFHTASLRRVWLNMVMPSLLLGALAWWLGNGS